MLRLLACAAALALGSAGPKQKQQQEQVEALKKGMAGVAQTNQKEAIAKGMKGAKDAAKVAAAMCGEKPCQIGHTPDELYDKANVSKLPKSQLGFIDFICTPVCTLPRPAAPPIAARSRASTRLGAGHALCRAFLPR